MNISATDERVIPKSTAKEASEWRFVIITTVIVLLVTSLPYLYAHFSAPPDKQFMGIMLDVPDHGQYFSWMRELTNAHLSANKMTPEPNSPVFFNLLWWGMGRLGRLLGWNYAGMFQLLRVVAGALFLLLAYRVCAWFLADRLMRRVAFLVIVFTSGIGWVLIALKYIWHLNDPPLPLLVYIAEGNTFLGILGYPHFIGAALYILVFDLVLRGQTKEQLRYAIAAGVVALFLGWQHAYDLVLVYGVLASYIALMALRDRRLSPFLIKSTFIIGIISWWPALYSVLLTTLDPLWEEVLAQFANAGVYTPNPLQLPILFGPIFLLAIFTIIKSVPLGLKGQNNNDLFVKTWFLANFLLIYIPTDYQIHMLNGWQVPMAILATQGLFRYVIPWVERTASHRQWTWSKAGIRRAVVVVLILGIIPTNVYLYLWRFVDLARHDYPYYLHKDEITALAWLEENAEENDVTLSSLTIGQYVPALTGTRAFLAHWAQTVDFYGKEEMVNEFFAAEIDEARRQEILQQYSVDYVFYGPAEQRLGSHNLDASSYLRQVYTSPFVEIYAVQNENLVAGAE
jgi:hypothetical protein